MKELIQALINQGIITAVDIQRMTTLELLLVIVERVNELHDLTNEGLEAVQRLLDKGVQEEVIDQLEEWMQDGTFDTLINQTALKEVNKRIDETNAQLSIVSTVVDAIAGNDYEKIRKAIEITPEYGVIQLSNREYVINGSLSLKRGQILKGIRSGKENGTKITNTSNDYCFVFDGGVGLSEIDPPSYENISFECFNGIKHGDESNFLPITSNTTQNYITQGYIKNCYFKGDNSGVAINLCGQYRSSISSNYIEFFDKGIRLIGCDLNEVKLNRVWKCSTALIELLSLGTGGSQNKVIKNDLLQMNGKKSGNAMIISSDQNPLIEDNYFEKGRCESVIRFEEANNGGVIQTITVENNRVEIDASESEYFISAPSNFDFLILNVKNNTSRKGTNGFLQNNNFSNDGVRVMTNGMQEKKIEWSNSPSNNVPFVTDNSFIYEGIIFKAGNNLNSFKDGNLKLKAKNNRFIINPAVDGSEVWFYPQPSISGCFDIYIKACSEIENESIIVQARNETTYVDSYKFMLTKNPNYYSIKSINRENMRIVVIGDASNTGPVYLESIFIKKAEKQILFKQTVSDTTYEIDLSQFKINNFYLTLNFTASNMFDGEKIYYIKKVNDNGDEKFKCNLVNSIVTKNSVIDSELSISSLNGVVETTGSGGQKRITITVSDKI